MTDDASPTDASYPRRFGWGMRVFLVLFLFDMIFRASFWTLQHFDITELGDRETPMALPSRSELAEIDAGKHPDGYETRTARYVASLSSAARFMVPRPEEPLESAAEVRDFAGRWLMSRLVLLGHVTGNDQTWQMFSNVPESRRILCVRLIYEDGTAEDFHGRAHQADFTRASHWFEEKRLQSELNAMSATAARYGYCNWLTHHHGTNAAGSPLKTIELSSCRFYRTAPGEDVRASLKHQSSRPADQMEPVFWRYDVHSGKGR